MKSPSTHLKEHLVHQLPVAIAFIDAQFQLVDASDQWFDLYNVEKNTANPPIFKFFSTHEGCSPELLREFLVGSDTRTLKHKEINDDGKKVFESTFSPWYDEKENIKGTLIHSLDITREYQKDKELKKVNALVEATAEVAKVGSWEYNLTTEKLSWCKTTKEIHQVPQDYEPTVAEAIEFYKQGYSRNRISMLFHKVLQDGSSFNERLQIVTKRGEERWIASGGKPIVKNGKITKIFGTFQDIHEQVITEKRTKESEQLLTTLIDNLPLNVFIKDKDSRKILVNKAECEYLGTTPKELIGKTDFELYDKDIAQISRDEDLEVMRSLSPMLGKQTLGVKKDGTLTHFLTSKIPLLDMDGKAYALIGMSMDITNLKQKEEQLHNLINVTAIQNKKLINFAHIVSHNLRSHSANFSMLLDFLVNEKDSNEQQRIIKMLTSAADNLMDTLENLNEVVEISTNINLDKKSLNLLEHVQRVEQNLSAFIEKNTVSISLDIDPDLKVKSVPAYLESIILNLMTNAVKYREAQRESKIELKATKENNHVVFSVTDNGLGIDIQRYGDKLFGMYKTFHNHKDARGLGLYIIKNQIEAMGGNIHAESTPGKGSTFKVYFNEEA
ncbi:MAG: PAS domain-containing protein [Bacteroidota bacterium]